jgi:hypothetical protein
MGQATEAGPFAEYIGLSDKLAQYYFSYGEVFSISHVENAELAIHSNPARAIESGNNTRPIAMPGRPVSCKRTYIARSVNTSNVIA